MERKPNGGMRPDDERAIIDEFGLTNNEWLRYRGSGELPERANEIMRIRLEAQMAEGRHTLGKKILAAERVRQEGEFDPDLFSKNLSYIKQFLEQNINHGPVILEIARKFHDDLEANYVAIFQNNALYETIRREVVKITAIISKKIDTLDDDQSQAELLEATAYLLDRFGTHEMMPRLIARQIKKKRYGVIAILLKKDKLRNLAFSEFFNQKCPEGESLQTKSSDEFISMSPLLPSLADYTKKIIAKIDKTGFESVNNASNLISWILVGIKNRPALEEELKGYSVNTQEVANEYFDALFQKREEITRGSPSHYACETILYTLTDLYSLKGIRLTPPDGMADLLRKIYENKVVPFRTHGRRNAIYNAIQDLCELCHIDFDVILGFRKR